MRSRTFIFGFDELSSSIYEIRPFSFYDQVLDMSCLLGNVPPRFRWDGGETDVNTAFTIARGTQGGASLVEE